MACFIVPAAEAVVSTIITKTIQKKERNENAARTAEHGQKTCTDHMQAASLGEIRSANMEHAAGIPFSRKLKWLNKMLWGGTALLAFEHVWHGEVTPWFPFLTAADSPAGIGEMLHEMSTVGTMMAVLVTAVWIGMVVVTGAVEKRAEEADATVQTDREGL